MQFLSATFAAYNHPVPAGGANPASPYDPVDAAYAAARMLCANNAPTPGGPTSPASAASWHWACGTPGREPDVAAMSWRFDRGRPPWTLPALRGVGTPNRHPPNQPDTVASPRRRAELSAPERAGQAGVRQLS
jgi:hypothetical protein